MRDVGVDAMTPGNAGSPGTMGLALCNALRFELGTVKTPCPVIGDHLARHGVHDFHRAHHARLPVLAQDGFTGHLHFNSLRYWLLRRHQCMLTLLRQ